MTRLLLQPGDSGAVNLSGSQRPDVEDVITGAGEP
jgi:hypothetical protein